MKYEKNNRGFDQQAEITRCQVGPDSGTHLRIQFRIRIKNHTINKKAQRILTSRNLSKIGKYLNHSTIG